MTKTKLSSYLLPIVLVTVMVFSSIVLSRQVLAVKQETIKIQIPTIFIPGTNASNKRFDSLITDLRQAGVANDVLKVYVKENGEIKLSGKLTSQDQAPIIVVGYEDNSEEAVETQAKLFQNVLGEIEKRYQFSDYQAVGHSNGGLAITTYLEDYRQVSDPNLRKLVTIGTPFNGVEETESKTTELAAMLANATQLPEIESVLTIAGRLEAESDGVVPVASVLWAKEIYQEATVNYQEEVVTGQESGHSDLVTNGEVVEKLKDFLF